MCNTSERIAGHALMMIAAVSAADRLPELSANMCNLASRTARSSLGRRRMFLSRVITSHPRRPTSAIHSGSSASGLKTSRCATKGMPASRSLLSNKWLHVSRSMKSVGTERAVTCRLVSGGAPLLKAQRFFDAAAVYAIVQRHFGDRVARAKAALDDFGSHERVGKHRPTKRQGGIDQD